MNVPFPFSLRRRWGELSVYSFILFASLTFFVIQLTSWTLLNEHSRTQNVAQETQNEANDADESGRHRPEVPLWNGLFLFLALCLAGVGLVGLIASLRHHIVSDEHKAAQTAKPSLFGEALRPRDQPTVPDLRAICESPGTHLAFRLPIGTQLLLPLIGLMVFAIAWNLVAGGVMLHSWLTPPGDWSDRVFGSILRGIFVAVGMVLLATAFHRILLTFGIGPTLLEISDHPIYPGRRYRLLLQQPGVLRFRELTVAVVCEEIARFHQGTDTITSCKEVFRQPLFSRSDFETTPGTPLEQEFFLQLPLGAMHSFRQENNEIQWKIDVFAQLVGWPDIHRNCPLIVMPHITS